jgi:hypothetical protein
MVRPRNTARQRFDDPAAGAARAGRGFPAKRMTASGEKDVRNARRNKIVGAGNVQRLEAPMFRNAKRVHHEQRGSIQYFRIGGWCAAPHCGRDCGAHSIA